MKPGPASSQIKSECGRYIEMKAVTDENVLQNERLRHTRRAALHGAGGMTASVAKLS